MFFKDNNSDTQPPLQTLSPMFGPIGDALMALALFDSIIKFKPDATFCMITRHNYSVIKDLASLYPQISVRRIPNGYSSLSFFLKLLMERRTLVVLGVADRYSLKLKAFFFLFGLFGNKRIGLGDLSSNAGKGWLPLQTILPLHSKMPILEQYKGLLPYLGFDKKQIEQIKNTPPNVKLDKKVPQGFPFKKGEYLVVHPFGTSTWRTFPMRRWQSLLNNIAREHPELSIIITGGKKDFQQAETIASTVSNSYTYIDLPILEVAGIIDNAAFYLGVDTGITHLACILNQKSIIISHCGDRRWLPLYNPNARVLVNSRRCLCYTAESCEVVEDGQHLYRCLYDITDKEVFYSVQLALSSKDRVIAGFGGWKDEHTIASQ